MASLSKRTEVNLAKFQAKLKEYVRVSKKSFAASLNKQMLQLVVGAKGKKGLVGYTQKATEARIRADLARVVTYRIKGAQPFTARLSRVLAAQALFRQGIHITRAALDAKEANIIKQRVNHTRAYIAASWLFAAQKIAASVPGNTLNRLGDSDIPRDSKKSAAKAEGKTFAATPSRLSTTVFNTAEGASKIAAKAVPKALAASVRDMEKYIQAELGRALARETRGV